MESILKEKGMDALASLAAQLFELVGKKAPGFLFEQIKNGELILNKGLPEYIESNYSKCETIRTLIKRDAPTILEKAYEPQRFRINKNNFSEEEIHSEIGVNLQRTIVSGSAGSGKSVFLKRLFRSSIEGGITYYPVFFELRTVKAEHYTGLLDSIYKSIVEFSSTFTMKQFVFGLKKGLFYIMIDALDETPPSLREAVDAEIVNLARKYRKCPFVLTSRPTEDFLSWEGFHVAHLLPFSESQCLSFIKKIDYPEEKKSEFLEVMTGGGFEKNPEFLSNPLLASMMLLTFDEYGDIPARKHIFYEKCFQVLLREHDSSKGKYRREFKSGLDQDRIEDVFTYFCVLSYLDRAFVFSAEQAHSYIFEALEASGAKGNPATVCEDLVDAVSILQRDGGHYEFTHRSFQEYFYAKFVVKDRDLKLIDKISEIRDVGFQDDCVRMIADMDRTYFEREFLLPLATRIIVELTNVNVTERPDEIVGKFFASVVAREINKIKRHDDKSVEVKSLKVFFSVSHDESEYEFRRLNLILLYFTNNREFGYGLALEKDDPLENLSDEQILGIFGVTELPRNRNSISFGISAEHRAKMV